MTCWHFIVTGTVQGVGYRRYSQLKALELGLVGWTRNLYNGNVEIMAQGNISKLELYKRLLQEGPRMSRVDSVEVSNTPPQNFSEFTIYPDSEGEETP